MSYTNFVNYIMDNYQEHALKPDGKNNVIAPVIQDACRRLFLLRKESEHYVWVKENKFSQSWIRLEAMAPPLQHPTVLLEMSKRYTPAEQEELSILVSAVEDLRNRKQDLEKAVHRELMPRELSQQESELNSLALAREELLVDTSTCMQNLKEFFEKQIAHEERSELPHKEHCFQPKPSQSLHVDSVSVHVSISKDYLEALSERVKDAWQIPVSYRKNSGDEPAHKFEASVIVEIKPDGQAGRIRLLKGSKIASDDISLIRAVQESSPFSPPENYKPNFSIVVTGAYDSSNQEKKVFAKP